MLFDKVCEELNLVEKDYFALSYRDKEDIRVGVPILHNFLINLSGCVWCLCVLGRTVVEYLYSRWSEDILVCLFIHSVNDLYARLEVI